jgi:predicted TIM-barrel fold metal-dependent hydrolase
MSSRSSSIHSKLGHPVVDADGHWLEFVPAINEYLERVGGRSVVDGFRAMTGSVSRALTMSMEERRERRRAQEAFWAVPTKNTLDRATAMLPRLLYQRLDEFGIDFAVLYPTSGLRMPFIGNEEIRRAGCRAFNMFQADQFRELKDRLTPAAVIPMHTPEEAIEELEYAVTTLGLKVVLMASMMRRTIPAAAKKSPDANRYAAWFDMLGLDSEHDYDAVWKKCIELKVSPTFHSGTRGLAFRVSPSNFVYNHIGHFAVAGEAVCKALFLGGVTRRFPALKFAFLEGGVGWACNLYADLVGHWKKRNREALEEVNPANLDRKLLLEMIERYGSKAMAEQVAQSRMMFDVEGAAATGGVEELDDFAACRIKGAEEIGELFTRNFYFGCEADDPINAWAFDRRVNPFGARLNVLFGSDIGHFDVSDMAGVLEEAFELVEHRLISEEDFRDFVFANPVRFWGESNPDFFKGTVVENQARALLNPV